MYTFIGLIKHQEITKKRLIVQAQEEQLVSRYYRNRDISTGEYSHWTHFNRTSQETSTQVLLNINKRCILGNYLPTSRQERRFYYILHSNHITHGSLLPTNYESKPCEPQCHGSNHKTGSSILLLNLKSSFL